ncbi:MAG: dihydrodipicolinate synthase family protein [Pseudolabrys sp.]|jgi:4-hydroxy-tetrahydrodipicolinate synthase
MSTPVSRLSGVMSPVLTPFNGDLTPSPSRFVKHCRWLLKQEVGLAIFGTNSEANSLTVKEKVSLLDALLAAGLPAAKMMPGTGTCALPDTIELTRRAVEAGCAGVLMLPPFYYKGVSDEGLFRSFARVIDAVTDDRLRIYLYHIPPVSQVPITLTLIERLLKAFPGIIAGVKDSSGDWNNTAAMLKEFQPRGFDVFAGTETILLKNMRGGGAGCITATGNVNPTAIMRLYKTWQAVDADAQQEALNKTRATFQKVPIIPAMKAVIAEKSGDKIWATVRPPLVELNDAQRAQLIRELDADGFGIPNASELADRT